MKKYYHVCSHGLEKNILFSDDHDFIIGINDIAISLLKFDLKIICYCLMSNMEVNALHNLIITVNEIDNSDYLENAIA